MIFENFLLIQSVEFCLSFLISYFLARSLAGFFLAHSPSIKWLQPLVGLGRLQLIIWLALQLIFLGVFQHIYPNDLALIKGSVIILGGFNLVSWFAIANRKSTFLLITLFIGTILLFLNVTGLLNPLIHYLDTINLGVGKGGLTFLTLIKAFIVISLFLKGIFFITKKVDEQINQLPNIQPSSRILISKVQRVILIGCAVLFGLSFAGIDLSAFTFFAGALGVGIGLGLQNVFSNFFSGLILLSDSSIRLGDVIAIDSGSVVGVVHKLKARYVCIRTREGKKHLIPNERFINNNIENWSYGDKNIRIQVDFKVHFSHDLDQIKEILLDIAEKTSRILASPTPGVRFYNMQENFVKVALRVWISDPENGVSAVQSELIYRAWQAFKKAKIELPLPAFQHFISSQSQNPLVHLKNQNIDL